MYKIVNQLDGNDFIELEATSKTDALEEALTQLEWSLVFNPASATYRLESNIDGNITIELKSDSEDEAMEEGLKELDWGLVKVD